MWNVQNKFPTFLSSSTEMYNFLWNVFYFTYLIIFIEDNYILIRNPLESTQRAIKLFDMLSKFFFYFSKFLHYPYASFLLFMKSHWIRQDKNYPRPIVVYWLTRNNFASTSIRNNVVKFKRDTHQSVLIPQSIILVFHLRRHFDFLFLRTRAVNSTNFLIAAESRLREKFP